MFGTKSFAKTYAARLSLVLTFVTAFLSLQTNAKAQTSNPNIALKGSYATSVTDGVDVFSGKLEQVLPLIKIQGRGEMSQGLFLPLRNSEWRVMDIQSVQGNDRTYYYYKADQTNYVDNFARAGYTTLGKLEVETKFTGWFFMETPSLTVLKFTSNDGSIMDFRDVLTNGQPYEARSRGCVLSGYQVPNPPPACSRGRVFRSTDGSNATFVADADIYDMIFYDMFGNPSPYSSQNNIAGTLFLSNGTRIRIENNFNKITKITDRNGNYMNIEYVTEPGYTYFFLKKITDSLNREITINYGDSTQPSYFDEIVYKGFGETERRIRINYTGVGNVMVPGQSLGVPLFPGVTTRCYMLSSGAPCDPTPGGPSGPHYATSIVVPSSIVLPNGKEYQFYYNNYLELARIKYPTGSYTDYNYTGVSGAQADGFTPPLYAGGGTIYRRVYSVKNFDESGQFINEKTLSNIPEIINGATPTIIDNVTIDVKDSNGSVLAKSKHYFYDFTSMQSFYTVLPMYFSKEYKTEILDPVSQAVLRRTETTWTQREPFPWCPNGFAFNSFYICDTTNDPNSGPPVDPRVTEVKTTLETGQVTKKTFSYDQYNNVTDTYEYNYGSGQAGTFLRRSHTDYVTDSNYTSYAGSYLLRLPLQSWLSSDINGANKTSFTQYEYDNYNSDANHAPLVSRSNVSGFDTNYNSGFTRRGNLTAITSFTNAQDNTGPITRYSQYDILGNLVKVIDARGAVSTIDYSDRFGSPNGEAHGNWDTVPMPSQLNGKSTFAFATSTTNPLGYTTFTQVDYSTGLVVDAEDINENVTTSFYNDALDRQTQIITANNRPNLRNQKTFVFDDTNRTITITSDLFTFGDNLMKSERLYDSLGQITETRTFEAGGYVAVASEYDALGRAVKNSNPYRPYLNEPLVWTTTEYDSLGRAVKVKTADNSEALTSYDGNSTTVTDQAGRKRRSIVNAIGQLTRMDEPNSQNDLGTVDNPAQPTFYTYNTNGQLVKVTQGAQIRYYLYDSLGRLLRIRQPEQNANPNLALSDPVSGNSQWSSGSTYDPNGNALTTTDARGIVITQTYDALGRVLTKGYSDSTPAVTYTYDNPNIAFSKGQVTKVSSSISITEYTSFDSLGRILSHKQTTDGRSYTTAYGYNLSGALVEETYPSGRTVKNTFNNDAKLIDVSSKSASQPDFQSYANNFSYTAHGSVSQMKLGNGTWESTQFNSRLQVSQIALGSSPGATNLFRSNYDYGEIDASGNIQTDKDSGNIARQTISFAGLSQPFVQTYKYDSLNRLSEAKEMNGLTQTWAQNFGYDLYGNRTSFNQQKIGEQSITQTPAIDPSSNRLVAGQGFSYDFNGNLTQDNQSRQFIFNGDNRQVEVRDGNNNTVGLYYYDGSGDRVKKTTAWETTIFVYDATGRLVAEYSTRLAVSPSTSYLTSDNLGSPRVITDSNGNVVSRRDFMPFGEELLAGTANRTEADKFGSGNDGLRKRFTGYEKDTETGLDFAEARYYDNRYGRFTAIDPLLASGKSAEPQSFNRYVYVMNNPVTLTDPTGMWSDRDWYTVDSDLFGWFEDGPSVRFPIKYEEWTTTYGGSNHAPSDSPQTDTSLHEAGHDASLQGQSQTSQPPQGSDVVSYEIVAQGPNPAPGVDHPEIPNLTNMGTYQNVNGAFYAFVLKVNFAEGVTPGDYQHLRTAFILDGRGGVLGTVTGSNENPSGGQMKVQGQSRLVYDNPGLRRAAVQPNTTYQVAFVAGEYNKKTKQFSSNLALYGVELVIDKNNRVSTASRVFKLSSADFINATKSELPKKNGQYCIQCALTR
jgi:RHS repeat-associated protein